VSKKRATTTSVQSPFPPKQGANATLALQKRQTGMQYFPIFAWPYPENSSAKGNKNI